MCPLKWICPNCLHVDTFSTCVRLAVCSQTASITLCVNTAVPSKSGEHSNFESPVQPLSGGRSHSPEGTGDAITVNKTQGAYHTRPAAAAVLHKTADDD